MRRTVDSPEFFLKLIEILGADVAQQILKLACEFTDDVKEEIRNEIKDISECDELTFLFWIDLEVEEWNYALKEFN